MPPTLASPPWSPRSVNSIGIDIRSPRASSELLESVGRGRTQSLDMSNGRRRSSGDSFMSPQASLDSLNRSKELLQQSSTESIRFLYRHDSFVQEVQEERERVLKEARLLQDKQDEVERSLRRHLILKRHFGRFRHYYSKTNSLLMACNVFLNKTIALGWQHFQTWTVVLKKDNQLKRRALAALVSGNFRKAWSTWRAAAAALAVSSRRRRVAIQEWAGAGRRAAWLTWQEATVEWKMLMRAALAFITPAMRRGLLAWTRAVKEKAEKLMKLQSAAASMLDFDLRRALNSWVEQARAEVEKARRMRAAALEILGGKQRAAWRSWKELVDERRKLRHAAKGLTSPGLRRAMTTWIEMAIASKSNRDMLRRGMSSMRNIPVRKAYNSWHAQTQQLIHMRRAFKAIMHRGKRLAMNVWLETVAHDNESLAIRKRALSSIKNKPLRQAFNGWHELASGRSETLRKMRMVISSMRNKGLRAAMNAWVEQATERSEALRKMRKASASMRNSGLAAAMNSWVEQATHQANVQRKMKDALSQIRGGKRRAAWATWLELADERRKLRHAAKGLTSPGLHRAMTTWIEMAIASKSNRDMLRRGMSSMRNIPVRKAYNTLRAMWEQLCWMRKALASMIYAQARRGLNAWMARHLALRNATRESRKLAIFAARLLKGGKVKYGFDVWRQVCRREREDSEAKRIFRMIFRSKMLKFLYRWIRNGSNWKIDLVCSRLAQTEADLHEVRRAAKVMEAEAIELRRMLGDHNEERKSNLRLEAEANHLRSSLAETRALNKQLEERASHFDTQYRRLWRATHDPTYISSIQEEKRLHTYTPGSRSRVDEMQHRREQEDAALADHEPKSDDFLNIKQIPGEPALRCSRSSVMAVSTFSSRQMRSPSASPTRARSPGLNGELQRFSELRQWREAQLTPSAHSPALVSTSVGGTVSSGRIRSR